MRTDTIDARRLLAILRDHDLDYAEIEGEVQEATEVSHSRYSCAKLNEWLDANSPYGSDF